MKLKYLGTLLPQQNALSPIRSVACSPDGEKTAIATADRSVLLFDEQNQSRDRFATKPVEAKFGKRSYAVRSIVFSPDSTQLAVGQTDCVLYVYRLGLGWNAKKVISNKLVQPSAVTAIVWPFDDKLIMGLHDGKVRAAVVSTSKCASLYKTSAPVVTIAMNSQRAGFASGHDDGSVVAYSFGDKSQRQLFVHSCPPVCLAFTAHGIVAAGADRRVVVYSATTGAALQQFDYSNSPNQRGFSALTTDSVGLTVVLGSYDSIISYAWNGSRGAWEPNAANFEMKNMYGISALATRPDGATIFAGVVNGALYALDCCLKRAVLRSRFSTTYVAPNSCVLKDLNDARRRAHVLSKRGLAIDELKVLGAADRFVLARTSGSLIFVDIETDVSSEIDWSAAAGGHEKFYFDYPNAVVIFNAGELLVVELGEDAVLGWVRTELVSPHLISIRITRPTAAAASLLAVKKVAYLVDPSTLAVFDLDAQREQLQLVHASAVDWLELNESATRLLFRDKRAKLTLVDVVHPDNPPINLLPFCSYVQWVPMSDVIVAQSGENLHIWYNPDFVEQQTVIPIKGDVDCVLRDEQRTEVIVQEPTAKVAYELDAVAIEFSSSLESRDYVRAVTFLERLPNQPETYQMWRRIGDMALEDGKLTIAQRCFAAVDDFARVRFVKSTADLQEAAAKRLGGDGLQDYRVRANLARLKKEFKTAEKIYLEQNHIDEAIDMWRDMQRWDEALELAKARNYAGYEQLKTGYYRSLLDTGQNARAAQLKVAEGALPAAIDLYLKANQPLPAAQLIQSNSALAADKSTLETVVASLLKNQIFDKAGELLEQSGDPSRAAEAYRSGKAYAKAIPLARASFPERVVELEAEWAEHLAGEQQYDAAVNHFLEANLIARAIDAAIAGNEWSKAAQIVDVIEDREKAKTYYAKIAQHYADVGELDRAERLFLEAGEANQAIHAYLRAAKWTDAYRLSEEYLGKEESTKLFERKAQDLEEQTRLAEAEQMYVALGKPEKAIEMYRKVGGRHEDVVRLIETHHAEHLADTHHKLAEEFAEKGELSAAEDAFLRAGDWRAVVSMYRDHEQWTDALRVAKSEGGETAGRQVIYAWARSLGGAAAFRLLERNAAQNDAIDMAMELGHFDFAFDIAQLAASSENPGQKSRLADVHAAFARQLEDEGNVEEAADHFVSANLPREAIRTLMQHNYWETAERLAAQHAPDALPDVLLGQARKALAENDTTKAESYLLRAGRPDLMLRYFKQQGAWPDALRIAKDYVPSQLAELEAEYEKIQLRSGSKGAASFVVQAKEFAQNGDFIRAVISYLKVDSSATDDAALVERCALDAADIAIKFLITTADTTLLDQIGARLADVGAHEKHAELLLARGRSADAVEALCTAKQWQKARKLAMEMEPALVPYVENAYKEELKAGKRLDELMDVDAVTAIDLLIEQGEWERALETARQTGHRPLLDKYLATRASEFIEAGDFGNATRLIERYGASTNAGNDAIYQAVFDHAANDASEQYDNLATSRNVMFLVWEAVQADASVPTDRRDLAERRLRAVHYLAMHAALNTVPDSKEAARLRLKLRLSLLRYSDLIPADRVFFTAGIAAREAGSDDYEALALLLLNHYLDMCEAIEDGNPDAVDYALFDGTDIPVEVPLPDHVSQSPADHESARDWVLAVSVDDRLARRFVVDERGVFEASLGGKPACVISGYPVLGSEIRLGTTDLVASRDAFGSFLMTIKTNGSEQLEDVHGFLARWAGAPLAMTI